MPTVDLMFASVAGRHDMVLVTRNLQDFAGMGVTVLNPWLAEPIIATV